MNYLYQCSCGPLSDPCYGLDWICHKNYAYNALGRDNSLNCHTYHGDNHCIPSDQLGLQATKRDEIKATLCKQYTIKSGIIYVSGSATSTIAGNRVVTGPNLINLTKFTTTKKTVSSPKTSDNNKQETPKPELSIKKETPIDPTSTKDEQTNLEENTNDNLEILETPTDTTTNDDNSLIIDKFLIFDDSINYKISCNLGEVKDAVIKKEDKLDSYLLLASNSISNCGKKFKVKVGDNWEEGVIINDENEYNMVVFNNGKKEGNFVYEIYENYSRPLTSNYSIIIIFLGLIIMLTN